MNASSAAASLDANGRSWIVLDRLELRKQGALADECRIDPGSLSAFVNGKGALKLRDVQALIAALGLKCVDANSRCVRAETFAELTRLAGRALIETPQLVWEET